MTGFIKLLLVTTPGDNSGHISTSQGPPGDGELEAATLAPPPGAQRDGCAFTERSLVPVWGRGWGAVRYTVPFHRPFGGPRAHSVMRRGHGRLTAEKTSKKEGENVLERDRAVYEGWSSVSSQW